MPSSSCRALMRMRPTGKKTKVVTKAIVRPMVPLTKTSPLIAPRAARPCVNREQEPAANEQGAVAHADLCLTCGTEEVSEENPAPAVQTEDEALCKRVDEAKASAEQQGCHVTRIGPRPNQSG